MDELLVAEILTSDSDEINELRSNTSVLENFVELVRKIDNLPGINKRFYEDSRSLYQATSINRQISELESILAGLFGPPIKPASKPLPRKYKRNSSVKYLGGIQRGQSFFLLSLKTGEFYAALWPWRRNKKKIEVHLGYCSDWITDEDYHQIETLVKRNLSKNAFEKMDTAVGGQIHGISLPSFLQMSELERSSYSLLVKSQDQVGRLFISNGGLIAASLDDTTGCEAAYRIISWDNPIIEIAPAEMDKEDEIKQPLMHVLMESLKIKDELAAAMTQPPRLPKPKSKAKKSQKPLVRLERAPQPKLPVTETFSKKRIIKLLIIGAVLIAIAFGIRIIISSQNVKVENFSKLMSKVEKSDSPYDKISLLENYLKSHPLTPYFDEIKSSIKEARQEVEDKELEQTTLRISRLEIDEHYEKKAIDLYGEFMEKYPKSHHAKDISKAIGNVKKLVDQYYYEELRQAARLNFKERLEAYVSYLNRFPEGRYKEDVKLLIQEIGKQYYEFLETDSKECKKNKRWDPCIERCQNFIDAYADRKLANQAKRLKNEMIDLQDLEKLRKKALDSGNNFEKTYQLYKSYLASKPRTSQLSVIQKELQELEKKLEQQRKWEAVQRYAINPKYDVYKKIKKVDSYLNGNIGGPFSSDAQNLKDQLESQRQANLRNRKTKQKKQVELERLRRQKEQKEQRIQRTKILQAQMEKKFASIQRYHSNHNGTMTDITTGLSWNILDSFQELNNCLNYAGAKNYVQSLRTGGYTDWRLPSPSELAAIYKQKPFLPSTGAQWFWTSESYSKGFHTVANIVTAKREAVFYRAYRDLNACGSVRAVRP
ncbi:MAG: DUF1566 domain-containing protein [Desulfobacteraceae bacterium]|nr:DUF1566 domain-containing protein [Desulfobacteraceae bacterium]